MLKTYSIKGNTVIIPFAIKTAVSTFSFKAEFKGGDAFGLQGKTKKAVYKTSKAMEQLAIEESQMFKRRLIMLEDCVETAAEIKAKAAAAARKAKAEAKEEAGEEDAVEEKKTTAKKK